MNADSHLKLFLQFQVHDSCKIDREIIPLCAAHHECYALNKHRSYAKPSMQPINDDQQINEFNNFLFSINRYFMRIINPSSV